MNDLLLQTFNTPFQSFPFSKVADADYEPSITKLLETAKSEMAAIADNSETATFENTIEAMEYSGKQLNRVVEAFFNLTSAETNTTLEELSQKIAPQLASFSNDILLNPRLYERVAAVNETADKTQLSTEQQRLLEKTYKGFMRNGAALTESEQTRLRELDAELSVLKVKFQQNVLQETNSYQLHLSKEEDVAGLPSSVLSQAQAAAKAKDLDGYLITLQYPSFVPFMQYAEKRTRREEIYRANGKKAFADNEFNNEKVIAQLVQLKAERAELLGYESHSAFVLEERMAKSPATVQDFLEDLLEKAKPFAQKEIEGLQELAAKDGVAEMMPWDHAFYTEKLRQQRYSYSEEEMKPYFPLPQVLEAAFGLATKLFGLSFKTTDKIDKYQQEVQTYEVYEDNELKALLYADWHPREGKRAGAWMTSYRGQYIDDKGQNVRPHISIVCNFGRPNGDEPSLLTFNEVTTLFHEFGHALHGIMANTKYESLSGTNVYWDFVELPSQFLENFCYDKKFLQGFAKHWKSGEALPPTQIDKLIAAANFMEGYQTLRQLSFAMLDVAYYSGAWQKNESISAFEQRLTAPSRLYPVIKDTAMSPSFSHIFGGGYDSGYYSYKWAEVLDADAFAYFEEQGLDNREVGAAYKNLLSKGGTEDPMELYRGFRGQEPNVAALLKRAGLVESK